jgi:hypothetical protein
VATDTGDILVFENAEFRGYYCDDYYYYHSYYCYYYRYYYCYCC